jgi:hypothetical protein
MYHAVLIIRSVLHRSEYLAYLLSIRAVPPSLVLSYKRNEQLLFFNNWDVKDLWAQQNLPEAVRSVGLVKAYRKRKVVPKRLVSKIPKLVAKEKVKIGTCWRISHNVHTGLAITNRYVFHRLCSL